MNLITVKVAAAFDIKKIIGQREIEVILTEEHSVQGLLTRLVNQYGEALAKVLFDPNDLSIVPDLLVMVNGKDIRLVDNADTKLEDHDSIIILQPVGRG